MGRLAERGARAGGREETEGKSSPPSLSMGQTSKSATLLTFMWVVRGDQEAVVQEVQQAITAGQRELAELVVVAEGVVVHLVSLIQRRACYCL